MVDKDKDRGKLFVFSITLTVLTFISVKVSRNIARERKKEKNALYFSVNVFSTKVLTGDIIFYVSYWRRDRHFTWSSEPREGLAACSTKVVPSFLNYFKTLRIGPVPGIEPATSRSAVTHSTDWVNAAAVKRLRKQIAAVKKTNCATITSLGSLSSDVFEQRTSTGSETFSLSICFDATKFVLLSVKNLFKITAEECTFS